MKKDFWKFLGLVVASALLFVAVVAVAVRLVDGPDNRKAVGPNQSLYVERDEDAGVTCYEKATYGGHSLFCFKDGCPR